MEPTTTIGLAEWLRTPFGAGAALVGIQIAWWLYGVRSDGQPRWSMYGAAATAITLLVYNAIIEP